MRILITLALGLALLSPPAAARTITGDTAGTGPAPHCAQGASLTIEEATMPYALMLIDAVDITTPEGWERATSMRPGDAETLGEPLPATQRDATTFTFDNLQEGLYLLRPERGADLLVTVPVANGQWECDVTITAKPAGTPSISHPAPVTAEPLPSRRLASTGANVLLIAALGALALLGGWALSRKGRG